jgi:hypothetical protein
MSVLAKAYVFALVDGLHTRAFVAGEGHWHTLLVCAKAGGNATTETVGWNGHSPNRNQQDA